MCMTMFISCVCGVYNHKVFGKEPQGITKKEMIDVCVPISKNKNAKGHLTYIAKPVQIWHVWLAWIHLPLPLSYLNID